MSIKIDVDVEFFPKKVLEKAVKLKDPLKRIYLVLYSCGKPTTPTEIAEELNHARAYVHMRLCQLESMGLAKRSREGRRVKFEAVL